MASWEAQDYFIPSCIYPTPVISWFSIFSVILSSPIPQ
jgi:hypothetical protein